MDDDDPRRPLLGNDRTTTSSRLSRYAAKLCSVQSWRARLPITIWLPKYNFEYLVRDSIAGITVGLTSIPQGIAYAIVAGVPPQVGLYSSIFPGYVYTLFGSCKDVTVGPTAILAALLSKYVAKSVAFAYLASFLSGCFILLLGVLQLGFLLDFISKPVISGFTTASALQIGAAQIKSLLRISGKSGSTFIDAIVNFFQNIKTIHLWDSLLGIITIISLLLFKRLKVPSSGESSRARQVCAGACLYSARARNALVVFAATLLAYLLYLYSEEPFALTGKIEGGLPDFGPPPFSAVVDNKTLNFEDMLSEFGAEGLVMPLVAVLESIAIAKAFAGSAPVDATQEMVAIGLCNIVSSFCQGMPATGSFTRTALNHASGVQTQAGATIKATLVLLAVTLLAPAFYFIPRATLAGVIVVAMSSIVDFGIILKLWRNSKKEFAVYAVTLGAGLTLGLEYGIAVGAGADALRALYGASRPDCELHSFKVGNQSCLSVSLSGSLCYASAQYVSRKLSSGVSGGRQVLVLDGKHLHSVDIGVAESLIAVILELEAQGQKFLLWNFTTKLQNLFEDLHPGLSTRLVHGTSIDQHVLGLEVTRRNSILQSF